MEKGHTNTPGGPLPNREGRQVAEAGAVEEGNRGQSHNVHLEEGAKRGTLVRAARSPEAVQAQDAARRR
eukprot:7264750-Lingulodinium_polyedra.AAC.1